MKALLVANPHSGGLRRSAEVTHIEERLHEAGFDVHPILSGRPSDVAVALGDALRAASPENARVVVVGGDGTIRATLPAVMGTDFPLAVVPTGTFNALAGELQIPLDLNAAIEVAVRGRVRRIDLGLANGRPFSQMVGLGFDGAVVHHVLPAANKNLLSPSSLVRGAKLLASYAPSTMRVIADGIRVEVRAWAALVANASRYTYRLRLAPGAAVDDGLLDVWLFEGSTVRQAVGQIVALVRRRHDGCPGIHRLRVRSACFESLPPAWLHLDGDPAGLTPVAITVAAGALRVVVPD
jgi:YegS/Rv2252/BmrU family lipid kinase